MGSKKYSTSLDIWSVGCIFAEMANGRPLFAGSSDQDQLLKIFQVIGTPNPQTWTEVKDLPLWKDDFPRLEPQPRRGVCPRLDPLGIDLLFQMLVLDPSKRITAREAMRHAYFLQ
eukprot:Protomagalhaensia_wolfi_Nauph_80__5939@NODE_78_length_3934_cov_38_512195_g59_i0_p5_GENE_NODE_78_length_3934_cov_38_512195_g59_i0NODE_78_length_3934_cov_38_512195_g59_i0_p5_ORF_typecomplete_len115_score6_65Pkinase/PF00069_25/5_2e17Pkinase_Tyr/PF07714_17/0_00024_NODE_78_length_3934_cov_38_512195_g59_i06941038